MSKSLMLVDLILNTILLFLQRNLYYSRRASTFLRSSRFHQDKLIFCNRLKNYNFNVNAEMGSVKYS